MYSENPLCSVILSILKYTDEPTSLYELMQEIEQQGYALVDETPSGTPADQKPEVLSSELKLFRKNFIVMNALYQIKRELSGSGFNLTISSLSILLSSNIQAGNQSLPVSEADIDDSADKALSDYYLNWDNLQQADQQLVDDLLAGFWKRFTEYTNTHTEKEKQLHALQTLGVESDASWENIKEAYRNKVAIHHPDKGGTSAQFIEIREAYQILYLIKRSSV